MYSTKNGLKINPWKSAVMFFGPNREWSQDNFKVQIAHESIPVVSEYKNLGVWFDSDLRFKKHV